MPDTLAPIDGGIFNLKVPQLPQFRFEWHPGKRCVYLIRASAPTMGDPIAEQIETPAAAQMAVLIWCRGFHEGSTVRLSPVLHS